MLLMTMGDTQSSEEFLRCVSSSHMQYAIMHQKLVKLCVDDAEYNSTYNVQLDTHIGDQRRREYDGGWDRAKANENPDVM